MLVDDYNNTKKYYGKSFKLLYCRSQFSPCSGLLGSEFWVLFRPQNASGVRFNSSTYLSSILDNEGFTFGSISIGIIYNIRITGPPPHKKKVTGYLLDY